MSNAPFRSGGNNNFQKSFKDRDEKGPKLGHLPEEMMAYYRQVSATMDAGFDEDDPSVKREFLNNVYNTLKDEGIQVSQNQTVSRILEALFTHSEALHLRMLFNEFCKDLTTVSFDRFASHVLQSLIHRLPAMYDDADLEDTERILLTTSIEQLCKFGLSNIRNFMTDTYGSHVLRSLLEILGGVVVKEEVIRSHVSRNQRKDTDVTLKLPVSEQLSNDFRTHFDNIKDKVIGLCNYADHLTDANYCPVIQTVLLILHKSDTSEYTRLAKTFMGKACPPPAEDAEKEDVAKNLPEVVQDSVGSYLIELLVSLTSEDKITKLYQKLFKGKLIYFSVHPVANYVLQKFFSCLTNTELLKEVVLEISQFLEDILAVNHIGVITKLAEACKKNQAQQEQFTQAVMKAFHCDEPKDRCVKVAPLIASMKTYDVFFSPPKAKDDEEKTSDEPSASLLKSINIHGSLLLQQMLQFDRPKHIVTSLLSLSSVELSNLASDQCGSHVVEAFFNSSTVWDKNKDEFLKKIKGFYVTIACSKNGSRCLEGIWKECALKMKLLIAEELMKSQERLESDRFGHFLYHNFALKKFSSRRKEWMDFQSGIKKKQQMLQAILEGSSSRKKKNRKRKAPKDDAKENDNQSREENTEDSNMLDSINLKTDSQPRVGESSGEGQKSVGKKRKKNEKLADSEGKKHKNNDDDGGQKGLHKKKKNKKKKLKE